MKGCRRHDRFKSESIREKVKIAPLVEKIRGVTNPRWFGYAWRRLGQ